MVLMVLLVGCDSELAPGGLCPTCVPQTGGETSDFGGGSECQLEERALTPDSELRPELDTTLAAYAGRFERTLRWSAPDATRPFTPDGTTIRGNVEVEDGAYFANDSVDCGEVQLRTRVTLETADGGLQATSEGALRFRPADGTSYITAASDLSEARGNLDLRLDSAEPHVGRLLTSIVANADGLSGAVTIEVSYFADRDSAEAYARGEKIESTSEFRVVGTF
jgi:hypothetical protein